MTPIDPRFIQNGGLEIFTGEELIVKGALEVRGSVHLIAGYPCKPLGGVFSALQETRELLMENGIEARIAGDEAMALAMIENTRRSGGQALGVFSGTGLQHASYALTQLTRQTYTGPGGAVLVVGDDPWEETGSPSNDPRFTAAQMRMPMVSPASPQELKDWIDLSYALGRASNSVVSMLVSCGLADGGGTVQCRPNHYPQYKAAATAIRDEMPAATLAPMTALKRAARQLGINRILYRPQKDEVVPIGFIASGVAYADLAHALAELNLSRQFPILKLGLTWPIDGHIVTEFAQYCERIVVIEERRSFIERRVLETLHYFKQEGVLDVRVYGKNFPEGMQGIPAYGGLNPSILIERLVPLLKRFAPGLCARVNPVLDRELTRINATANVQIDIPRRKPTFCTGCPNRDTTSVFTTLRRDLANVEYMRERYKRKPIELVIHGDSGCSVLFDEAPTEGWMTTLHGSGYAGIGATRANKECKHIALMGDGTFYHSGQNAIRQSIETGQDVTYIILDNKTTARTGQQLNPSEAIDFMGRPRHVQDIERLVQAMVPKNVSKDVSIVRIDPSQRDRYRKLLEDALVSEGVKIIIADKECGITFQRKVRTEQRQTAGANGYLPRQTVMRINTDVCEYCLECTTHTGCSGLTAVDTERGLKMQTDATTCVNDGACVRTEACPSFEQITIVRNRKPQDPLADFDLNHLPTPPSPIHGDQQSWRCGIAGIGGMGVGVLTAVLVAAGHSMGYHVRFREHKGKAVRNGSVMSQLLFARTESMIRRDVALESLSSENISDRETTFTTPLIPYGKADLLIGLDLLEACRLIDPLLHYRAASAERTAAVINTAENLTTDERMSGVMFDRPALARAFRQSCQQKHCIMLDLSQVCEKYLGNAQPLNMLMLGLAFQQGLTPLRPDAVEAAIQRVLPHDSALNIRAFRLGRLIAVEPSLLLTVRTGEPLAARLMLRRKVNDIMLDYSRRGRILARRYRQLLRQTIRRLPDLRHDDETMRHLIVHTSDCLYWGGLRYAEEYCEAVVNVYDKDEADKGYALTRIAIDELHRVMVIKDEIHVARLLTLRSRIQRDRAHFQLHDMNEGRLIYRHYLYPEFEIFGSRMRIRWRASQPMLKMISRARWMRNVIPGWHKREKQFRKWYQQLLNQVNWKDVPANVTQLKDRNYQRWLMILAATGQVNGFGEVRYSKMTAARQRADRYLALPPDRFEPADNRSLTDADGVIRNISLPILDAVNR